MKSVFESTEILLPDFCKTDGTKWAVVACDQFTSEADYWESAAETVGGSPSTLNMILPEVYLSKTRERIPKINAAMTDALKNDLVSYPDAMIYLERVQSDGLTRRGLVGMIDLEQYDFSKGASSLIRATEGTVLERIPPRVAIRRDAPIEFPHVMLLIDDPERTVIEPLTSPAAGRAPIYDFDLMLGGGHVRATLLTPDEQTRVTDALASLVTPDAMKKRYGDPSLAPLLFAVGDGNHSLATAKTIYEELKKTLGTEAAKNHPARYALVEVVNLHDDALRFEPIYRVVFGADPDALIADWSAFAQSRNGSAAPQDVTVITAKGETRTNVPTPEAQLAVGTLQAFLTDYTAKHPGVTVDYIHGEDSLRALAAKDGAVGFLFEGMRKDELFRTVIFDGALPRKTFSMGHARDKRYYVEGRRIR